MERLSSSDSCTTRPQNEIIDADAVRRMVADDRLDSEEARMILTKYLKIRGDLETLRDRRKVEISAETKEAWNALDKAVRARIQRDLPVEDDGVIGPYTISRLAVRALSSDQAHQSLSCEAKPDLAATAETQTEPVLPRGKDEGDKTNTPSASWPKPPSTEGPPMGTSARIDSGTEQNLQYAEIPTLVGSVPPGKGERPGNTYCSRTAVANFATHFGILAPEWNAKTVQWSIPRVGFSNPTAGAGEIVSVTRSFDRVPADCPVFDVFTGSDSPYGHRCAAYRCGGQIMVLDPYFCPPGKTLRFKDPQRCEPMPLDQYLATNTKGIKKIAAYRLPAEAATQLAQREASRMNA